MERLDGKKILITGGTSGMGQAMVEGFSKLGANLVFWGRNTKAGTEISEATGARFIQVEISDETQVNAATKETAEFLGGIDVLIHAAAIDSHCPAEMITCEEWKRLFDVNAAGTFYVNKAVFPYMKEKGGNIINFTSASAYIGGLNQAHYAATKGAVTALTRSLSKEWMRYRIRVNAIAPCIWTPMYEKSRAALGPEQVAAMDAALANTCLGGKLGDPETDFLPVMAFMASDSSQFMTGQTISIDGGIMMVR